MEEIKEKQEENKDTAEAIKNTEEPVDLIEMVREKHQDNYTPKDERLWDIFTIQLILCVLIVLAFVIINIFDKELTQWYIAEFKRMTIKEPEKIIKDAVNFVVDYIK